MMSYQEALRDGVRIAKTTKGMLYFPRCRFCGMEVQQIIYIPKNQYVCAGCRPKMKVLLSTGLFSEKLSLNDIECHLGK